eukprot:COSAG06_NODE_57809_length_279_cov_0.577778_1_plen_43_part_10
MVNVSLRVPYKCNRVSVMKGATTSEQHAGDGFCIDGRLPSTTG